MHICSLVHRVTLTNRACSIVSSAGAVGEYHLDLIVGYGAAPVIVPRVPGVDSLLDAFEPIHGVLLCEGEDIDPSLYQQGGEAEGYWLKEAREAYML